MTQTLHMAAIVHRHGVNLYGDRTAEGLERQIFDFVDDWWATELPDRPMPTDPAEAIEAYFAAVDEESLHRDVTSWSVGEETSFTAGGVTTVVQGAPA